ncbi:MAG: glycosyltransferase [Patescibacteria group bacterium]|nr:glycosyltransferase [Patescibacteria group bacterium]
MNDLYLLLHGRFPSEKAAGLFADKSAEAFARIGLRVTVLVPRRFGRGTLPPRPYAVQYVATLDLFRVPLLKKAAYRVSYIFFSLSSLFWLLRHAKRRAVIYSNETFPTLLASFFFKNTLYEVHDFPEKSLWMYRALFRRTRFVLATNEWKASELQKQFSIPKEKIIVERNAVDVEAFALRDKSDARKKLHLPIDGQMVVYTGHLYAHKGVDTLIEAIRSLPDVALYIVGGTQADRDRFLKKYSACSNVHLVGHVPHSEVPLWQSAADVLVLPNSARELISAQYTSPMKLFEYMASGRPIVASNVPSIAEVVSESSAYLVAPDNAGALKAGIVEALGGGDSRAYAARALVLEHTWDKRAQRIFSRIRGTF